MACRLIIDTGLPIASKRDERAIHGRGLRTAFHHGHGQMRRHMTTLPELDPVIHAAARLKVMATLAACPDGDRISFSRLQKLLGMTAGNLSTNLRKLEDAGYVAVT